MTRLPKTTEEKAPVVNEKEAILVWLRSSRINMFERSSRWLADRIEAGDHLI